MKGARMMMKKVFAVLLAFAVQFTIWPALSTASGEELKIVPEPVSAITVNSKTISSQQAMEIFCSTFPEITANRNLVAELDEYAGNSLWRIYEADPIGLHSYRGQQVGGQIDAATGEIQSFNYNPGPDYYQCQRVTLTREQAKALALKFLQEKQPVKYEQLLLRDDLPASIPSRYLNLSYTFNWQRQVNGTAIDYDSISVGVNAYTGQITQYHCNWHELELPVEKNLISPQLMAQQLQEQIDLLPCYTEELDSMGQRTGRMVPSYRLNISAQLVDARTGQFLDYLGRQLGDTVPRLYEQDFVPLLNAPAINQTPQPQNYVDPEAALQAAWNFFSQMGYNGPIRKSGSGGSSGGGIKEEHWSYSLQNPNEGRLRVEVNAYTGEVIGFNDEDYSNTLIEPVMSYAQGRDLALAAIEKYDPDKVEQVAFCQSNWEDDRGYYHYQFVRLVNGIPYNRDSINITLDGSTGKVASYLKQWRPVQCEALPPLQDPQLIKNKLWSTQNLQLSYILARDDQYVPLGESIPVYIIPYTEFNAVSGEALISSQAPQPGQDEAEPWKDHWAAPSLSLLKSNGLTPESTAPDEAMTRREILKILVLATNPRDYYGDEQKIELALADIAPDDPDLSIFKLAIQRNIIANTGEFRPDEALSREELAIWLVNSLGLQEIARIPNRIDTPFRDAGQIAAHKSNYLGLVFGLGLLTPDSKGNIRPQEKVSWAQMASVAGRLAPRALAYPGPSIIGRTLW
jgi:hypothetical protein